MGKGRLEAFSDGVLAIIITIMVLEMKVPHGEDLAAVKPLLPGATSRSMMPIPSAYATAIPVPASPAQSALRRCAAARWWAITQ